MERPFTEYIGYIIFFILFVLPRVIKFFTKAARSGAPSPKPTPAPTAFGDLIKQLTGTSTRPVVESRTAERRVEPAELLALEKETARLLEVARQTAYSAAARGGAAEKLVDIVKVSATAPIEALADELSQMKRALLVPTAPRIIRHRDALKQIDALLRLLQLMAEQRRQPDPEELLRVFDIATGAFLAPCIAHAKHLGISYTTRSVLALFGPTDLNVAVVLRRSHLAAVVVEKSTADRPCGWVAIASDSFLDLYYSTTGLARRLAADLGAAPPALSLTHYTDHRSLVAGLMGSYIPRLFADTAAALHLGPGFPFGLQAAALEEDATEQILTSTVDGSGPMPWHLRMFAVCRALSHIGFQKEAASYWESWNERLEHPLEITVRDPYGRTAALPANTLLNAVARVVDHLMTTPIAPLGGVPLGAIASLACDASSAAEMNRVAPNLAQSEPLQAPTRILIGAALLAAAASPTAERRIGKTLFKSLLGKGIVQEVREPCREEPPCSFTERALHPRFVMRAIVVGEAIGLRHRGITR